MLHFAISSACIMIILLCNITVALWQLKSCTSGCALIGTILQSVQNAELLRSCCACIINTDVHGDGKDLQKGAVEE